MVVFGCPLLYRFDLQFVIRFAWACLSVCLYLLLSVSNNYFVYTLYLFGDQLRWAICFSGSPSLCFTLFCWHSFLLLHSWLNKLIDWLINSAWYFQNFFVMLTCCCSLYVSLNGVNHSLLVANRAWWGLLLCTCCLWVCLIFDFFYKKVV